MDSEIVNWLINNLPKLNLGGVDLTMPVWGGIGIVAIGGFLLGLFNFLTNVRSWVHKPPLGADENREKLDDLSEGQSSLGERLDDATSQLADGQQNLGSKLEEQTEAIARLEKMLAAQNENQGGGQSNSPDVGDAIEQLLNDTSSVFKPARERAQQLLADIGAGAGSDVLSEFDDTINALKSSLAQQAEMRAQMNREEAKGYRVLGELSYDRDPQTALEAYREATRLDPSDFWSWIYLARLEDRQIGDVAASKKAAENAANAALTERERAVALNDVGNSEIKLGNLGAARIAFSGYLEIARRLADANPASALAQRDVSVSLNKLGDVAVEAGDLDGARTAFEESLETRRALAEANPASAEAQRDVSVSLNRLGDVAVKAGDLGGARTAFEESLQTRRRLAEANPGSAQAQRDVIASLDSIGILTGDAKYWQEALEIAEALKVDGRLAPSDAFIPDYLREQIAAAE